MNTNELFPLASERASHKNIGRIVGSYAKYWYWFLISTVFCVTIGFIYLKYYAIPEYEITSTMLVKDGKSDSPLASESFNLNLFASSKNLNNEVEILESASLMERVVEALGLTTTYNRIGRFRNYELYGHGLPIRFVADNVSTGVADQTIVILIKSNNTFDLMEDNKSVTYSFGQQIHRPYANFTIVADSNAHLLAGYINSRIAIGLHSLKNVAANYQGKIIIAPVSKESTVLMVRMTDAIPERGRDVLSKLVEVYNQEALEDRNQIAMNTIHFLDDRLKFLTGELTSVEKNVEHYKVEHEVTDVSTQATNYLEQANDYNKKLADWDIQINILKSIESYLTKNENQYGLVPSALGIQDPTLASLISKFNELQLEHERMLRTTEPGNPLVMNINQQLASLKSSILEDLRNIKNGLLITSNNLRASSGKFKSRIQQVPMQERQLQDINRQQETKQKLYLYLLQKREEAGLSLAGTVANTRVIDSASSTDYPIRPSRQTIYLVALLIGFLLPFASIYFKELLNDKVQDRLDVERVTATPILGELSHNTREPLVMTKGNRSVLAEMFRLIRTNLHFAVNSSNNKVLLITSSMSREGKTFFSLNLGATLVLADKRVVVIEMDLRQPALLDMMQLASGVGITDYITSEHVSINELLHPVAQAPGLFIIGAGKTTPNPAELMMSSKLSYLLHELRENFDYIIIDTAPVGKVADAFTMSSLVDKTIYIIRSGYTLKKQLDIVDNIFMDKKLPNVSIVINDVRMDVSRSYSYGYEDNPKKGLLSRILAS